MMSEFLCVRPIPGHPGYFASITGRIYSQWRRGPSGKMGDRLRELRGNDDGKGYLRVTIDGQKTRWIAHLIAETFLGSRPDGFQVCHNNGMPGDNRLENLRYDTPKGNNADKHLHGTRQVGSRNPFSKLTELDVAQIRSSKLSGAELARMYGVSRTTISYIRLRKIWDYSE